MDKVRSPSNPYSETLSIEYSKENWEMYLPIFDEKLKQSTKRLVHLQLLHNDVLTYRQRHQLHDATRGLEEERTQYLVVPNSLNKNSLFQVRLATLKGYLGRLNREFLLEAKCYQQETRSFPNTF